MEIWKAIPGYENSYEASNHGRIRSIRKILRQRKSKKGYLRVNLYTDGRCKTYRVHQLIAWTFIGKQSKPQIAHRDGNKENNFSTNLRYATAKENLADRDIHGTNVIGLRNGRGKLTDEECLAIINDPRTQEEIAKDYGIVHGHVSRLKNRTIRKYLKEFT